MAGDLSEFDGEFLRGLNISTDGVELSTKSWFDVDINHIRANFHFRESFLADDEFKARDLAISQFYEWFPNVRKKSYPFEVSVERTANSRIPWLEEKARREAQRGRPLLREFYDSAKDDGNE
jgi:hypothetical protein